MDGSACPPSPRFLDILGEAELLERRGTVLDRHFSAIEIVLICAIRLGGDAYRHVII